MDKATLKINLASSISTLVAALLSYVFISGMHIGTDIVATAINLFGMTIGGLAGNYIGDWIIKIFHVGETPVING